MTTAADGSGADAARGSTALLTDHYELTMLDGAVADGTADRRVVFEVFCRSLPDGHGFGVLAGLGRLVDLLDGHRFGPAERARLRPFVSARTLAWLERWRFDGHIDGALEGEVYVPGDPVVTVRASFGSALLLETLLLSVLNHDSAVASRAARMVAAARGRPVIEMGGRRTHEEAAVAAARAAWIAGFASTSNLEAGRRHGLPTAGTAAHAWTMVHDGPRGEADAFRTQLRTMGTDTTLLVDTYDVDAGIATAVEVALELGRSGPGAIRLDSGDLFDGACRARRLLDELGARDTRIVVSGDLDEYEIQRLQSAPIDGYGVGTNVVAGLTPPGFVYKLVALGDGDDGLRPVAKQSTGKQMIGGRKTAWRERDADGHVVADHVRRLSSWHVDPDVELDDLPSRSRPLIRPLVRDGVPVAPGDVEGARRHHQDAISEVGAVDLWATAPTLAVHLPPIADVGATPPDHRRIPTRSGA